MLDALRKFLRTPAGMGVGALLLLAGVVLAIATLRNVMSSEGARLSADRVYLDAATDPPKAFEYTLKSGDTIPVDAPSGGKTGFPAEPCYWTKEGTPKTEPTWVLLNSYKKSKDPTFCPDCGRLVVGHNPAPTPGAKPPPTKAEYKPRPGQLEER